jgi:hypothetical protein
MPFVDVTWFGKGRGRAMLIALVIIGILIAAFLRSITSRRSLDMDEFYGFLD